MKSFLAITIILGCMAFLEARVLKNSAEQGGTFGNPFFGAGGNSNGNGFGGSPVIGVGGAAAAGDDNADDGGLDDDQVAPIGPGPGVVAGAGGVGGRVGGGGYDNNDGGGDTPDDGNVYSPARPIGGGQGDTVGNNPDQRVIDDTAEAADPGQIVGSAGSTGATIGIVAGVVALVGVAAGVAIYVIKKRN